MVSHLIENPTPDFGELEQVLRGEREPKRVHLVEWSLDPEVQQAIQEHFLGQRWVPLSSGETAQYYKQLVRLFYRLGYDYVPIYHCHNYINQPTMDRVFTRDTAEFSRGERGFVATGHGVVTSWEDFERVAWGEAYWGETYWNIEKSQFRPLEQLEESIVITDLVNLQII